MPGNEEEWQQREQAEGKNKRRGRTNGGKLEKEKEERRKTQQKKNKKNKKNMKK